MSEYRDEAPFLLIGEEPHTPSEEHRPSSTDQLLAAILKRLERLESTMSNALDTAIAPLTSGLGNLTSAVTAALSAAGNLAPSADEIASLGNVATGMQTATDQLTAFVTANTAAPEAQPEAQPEADPTVTQ